MGSVIIDFVDSIRLYNREVFGRIYPTQQNKKNVLELILVCGFCLNAFVDDELTHETDMSAVDVGRAFDGYRFMLVSGNRLPVSLEVDCFSSDLHRWVRMGVFFPRFCPMCGRELSEFNIDEFGRSYLKNAEQGS